MLTGVNSGFNPDLKAEKEKQLLLRCFSPVCRRPSLSVCAGINKNNRLSSKLTISPLSPGVSRTSRAALSHSSLSLSALCVFLCLSVSSFLAGFPPPPSSCLLLLLLLHHRLLLLLLLLSLLRGISSSSSRHLDGDGAARDACARGADAAAAASPPRDPSCCQRASAAEGKRRGEKRRGGEGALFLSLLSILSEKKKSNTELKLQVMEGGF